MSHSSPRWSGAGPLDGTAVEWFIQAVDSSGNVAVTSNKAFIESVEPEEPSGDIMAEATGPQASDWYTGTVTWRSAVRLASSTASTAPRSRPARRWTSPGPASTRWTSRAATAPTAPWPPIDVSDPTVSVNATYGFGAVAHATCADSGSGLASCAINSRSTQHELGRAENHPCPSRGSSRPRVRGRPLPTR